MNTCCISKLTKKPTIFLLRTFVENLKKQFKQNPIFHGPSRPDVPLTFTIAHYAGPVSIIGSQSVVAVCISLIYLCRGNMFL